MKPYRQNRRRISMPNLSSCTQASRDEARAYRARRREGAPAPVTKKRVRVPAVRFGSTEVSLPTLRIAALLIAAVFCVSHNGRMLYAASALHDLRRTDQTAYALKSRNA